MPLNRCTRLVGDRSPAPAAAQVHRTGVRRSRFAGECGHHVGEAEKLALVVEHVVVERVGRRGRNVANHLFALPIAVAIYRAIVNCKVRVADRAARRHAL